MVSVKNGDIIKDKVQEYSNYGKSKITCYSVICSIHSTYARVLTCVGEREPELAFLSVPMKEIRDATGYEVVGHIDEVKLNAKLARMFEREVQKGLDND